MSGPETTPILSAEHARVAVDDVIAIEDLSLTTRGDRVLLVGDVTVLFAALSGVPLLAVTPDPSTNEAGLAGEARFVGGAARLDGLDVIDGAHLAIAGFAPLDPPVPRNMTALAYVEWAARLAAVKPRAAREMAAFAMKRVGLLASVGRVAATLGLAERRALQLAKAIVNDPRVLVAEAPLDRLEGAGAAFVTGALAAATEGRRTLLSARAIEPGTAEGALARGASQLVFLGDAGVVAEGAPASFTSGARVYRLTVATNPDALKASLAARGLTLSAGPVHFTIALPEGTTTAPVVEAASEARAAVVEMVPIAR
ncbi:MAG: ABC transporter ATP-binding protein [Polyangiaceae bacterium]